jgi:ribose 5-phosphate isomerase B
VASEASGGDRTIAIGADHGGYRLKQALVTTLTDRGYAITDCGTSSTEAVDYPDFAHAVARLVASGQCACGIVVDGAGIGSAIVANKVPGVRAANAHDTSMARNAREHNYANVLTLGARMIGEGLALEIADTFLATPWGAERHGNRVAKITAIEQHYLRSLPEEQAT